jgi:hypothetical protein
MQNLNKKKLRRETIREEKGERRRRIRESNGGNIKVHYMYA